MKKIPLALSVLALSGCAGIQNFVEEHPKAAGIGFTVLVTSLALSASNDDPIATSSAQIPGNPCPSNPEACR
jgi:hypothetical protein